MPDTCFPAGSRASSFIYNALLATAWLQKRQPGYRLWHRAWRGSLRHLTGPVTTKLHGRSVVLNYGYTYPLNARMYQELNNPLVELVNQCFSAKQSRITLVDVGAAVGDTILLVYSNCPGMVRQFYCIDGDPTFFPYLEANLSHLEEGTLLLALLSASAGSERELVHIHAGTSSAQGTRMIPSTTLDDLLAEAGCNEIDVLKVDVDGFDGKVLLGARHLLTHSHPAVIFEWHPILCEETGRCWREHFDALLECGYQDFIWYNKFGQFSHFMHGFDVAATARLADLCLRDRFHEDWHYDVIALPQDTQISQAALAEMKFARSRRSRY